MKVKITEINFKQRRIGISNMEAFDKNKVNEMFRKLQFMTLKQAEQMLSSDPNVKSFSIDYENRKVNLTLSKSAEDLVYTESYKRYRNLKGLYESPNEVIYITVTVS